MGPLKSCSPLQERGCTSNRIKTVSGDRPGEVDEPLYHHHIAPECLYAYRNRVGGIETRVEPVLKDSQALALCVAPGLLRVPLEEQLKFGRPKTGGDNEMSHIMQTWVRMAAVIDRKDWSHLHVRRQNIVFESSKSNVTSYLSSNTLSPWRLRGCR